MFFSMNNYKTPLDENYMDSLTDETVHKRAQWEQFSFNVDALGIVDVTNESHENSAEHQYVVSIDDVTQELMACTCPHHVHRNAFCKHMTGVEDVAADGDLDAFPTEDSDEYDGPRGSSLLAV